MVLKVEYRFAERQRRRLAVLGRDVAFPGDGLPGVSSIAALSAVSVGIGSIHEVSISSGGQFLVDELVEETV